jgi:hypothetical protein
MPITPVAGEPRGLNGKNGANAPLTDRGEKLLKARPAAPAARSTKIVIDDLNICRCSLKAGLWLFTVQMFLKDRILTLYVPQDHLFCRRARSCRSNTPSRREITARLSSRLVE